MLLRSNSRNIFVIAHNRKLTRCDQRDAETAQDEQENSLHVSNAKRTRGPMHSGQGSRVNRRVVLLGIHVSSCVSSRLERRQRRSVRGLFSTSDSASATPPLTRHPPTSDQQPANSRWASSSMRRRSSNCAPKSSQICFCCWWWWCSAPLSCCRHSETCWLCIWAPGLFLPATLTPARESEAANPPKDPPGCDNNSEKVKKCPKTTVQLWCFSVTLTHRFSSLWH